MCESWLPSAGTFAVFGSEDSIPVACVSCSAVGSVVVDSSAVDGTTEDEVGESSEVETAELRSIGFEVV